MQGPSLEAMRRFVRDTRAGATAIAAAAVTVMTVGGAALISDHAWLIDQRDVLKTAADAAGVAATLAMTRLAGQTHTDEELEAELEPVVKRYILLNLEHLPPERYEAAQDSLKVTLDIDRDQNTVDVTAMANLGGTLFSRHMPLLGNYEGPSKILAKTGTQCSGGIIEVVLALDVTASMNAKIDNRYPKTPDNQRMPVAIEAAKTLVEELHSGCDDTDVVIGVVPWDKTVRLPSPEKWGSNGWVDTSNFGRERSQPGHEDWEGCVADRRHAAADPRSSDGLSLTLPGTAPIPAWMYPDANRLDPALIAEVRQAIFDNFSAHGVEQSLGATGVDQLLREHGDNSWDRAGRGPNFHCTWTAILPLSPDREEVEGVLDSLYDTSRTPPLMGGVTMSHLGLTWGHRMLAPTWREVWGDDTHPVEPADTVTKALVLLTDGQNGANTDGWGELPGRISARYDTVADELEFGCEPRNVNCHALRGDYGFQDDYASRYTAVGRFGEGRPRGRLPRGGTGLRSGRHRDRGQGAPEGSHAPLVRARARGGSGHLHRLPAVPGAEHQPGLEGPARRLLGQQRHHHRRRARGVSPPGHGQRVPGSRVSRDRRAPDHGAAHQLAGGWSASNRRNRMFDRQEPESVFKAATATDGREPETTGATCRELSTARGKRLNPRRCGTPANPPPLQRGALQ